MARAKCANKNKTKENRRSWRWLWLKKKMAKTVNSKSQLAMKCAEKEKVEGVCALSESDSALHRAKYTSLSNRTIKQHTASHRKHANTTVLSREIEWMRQIKMKANRKMKRFVLCVHQHSRMGESLQPSHHHRCIQCARDMNEYKRASAR